MKIQSVSFQELPFSKLFKDYLSGSENLTSFFEFDPFSEPDYQKRADTIHFTTNRDHVADALLKFNHRFDAQDQTIESIEKLRNGKTVTVVTGQQLILFGGPLFTIYKIITAIVYAKRLEKSLKRPVIPVFWMADEDHDYREAATLNVPQSDDINPLFYESEEPGYKRVSEIGFGTNFNEFKNQLKELLPETDFSNNLWNLMNSCYSDSETFGSAFGKLILKLFGKHGLILAGSNDHDIKKLLQKPLTRSIKKAAEIEKILIDTSKKLLTSGYHNQVTVQNSNLFWIDDKDARKKISFADGEWIVEGSKRKWSSDSLVEEILEQPNRFSPNVFLRPVLQNFLIPVVAYVAGPGEVAYYAQMRAFYEHFRLKMPIILPRFSATLIEGGIDRIIGKLPFKISDYSERIEDLESMYLKRADTPDIEPLFQKWKDSVREVSESGINRVAGIDPTLKKSADKTVTQFFTELDKLKGKVYRSIKEDEKVQLKRIQRIQENLFPGMNLQEREVAFFYFMNKYDVDLWDRLLTQFESEDPSTHKLIYV
ncbi:MAG: bacillithiol biosynthesis cysteine-adding enzyme BshC [Balneolaceae bacterium]